MQIKRSMTSLHIAVIGPLANFVNFGKGFTTNVVSFMSIKQSLIFMIDAIIHEIFDLASG